MADTEESAQQEISEADQAARRELDELEHEGDEMEERLETAESESDARVPEPGDAWEPGVDESDIPEGEGEAAEEAGQ